MSEQLSIVAITKNQEWHVERLINSAMQQIPNAKEFILVDSASTDKTVELARQFPIRIISLSPDQRLTAAAGRYVGYLNATGDYILFLDGDVELLEKWHEHALATLEANPDIGVVGGRYINVPKSGSGDITLERNEDVQPEDVFHCGGAAAIYRRQVLVETGSFSPHIFSDEEPALAVRIRHAGYRVVRLDYPSAFHYTDPPEKLSTIIARRNRNLWIGHGQNLRNFMGTDMLMPYLKERGHGIPPALFVVIGLVLLGVSLITRRVTLLALFIGGSLAMFAALAVYKRSIYKAYYTFAKRFIMLEGTVRGFFLGAPVKPEDYHVDYEIIK